MQRHPPPRALAERIRRLAPREWNKPFAKRVGMYGGRGGHSRESLLGGEGWGYFARAPRRLQARRCARLFPVRCQPRRSRQQRRNQFPVHVGQPEIAPLEAISQLGVIETEQV